MGLDRGDPENDTHTRAANALIIPFRANARRTVRKVNPRIVSPRIVNASLSRLLAYSIAHSIGLCQGGCVLAPFEFKMGERVMQDAKTGCRSVPRCTLNGLLMPQNSPYAPLLPHRQPRQLALCGVFSQQAFCLLLHPLRHPRSKSTWAKELGANFLPLALSGSHLLAWRHNSLCRRGFLLDWLALPEVV